MNLLAPANLYGQITAILRQELDSMIRAIYLLSIADRARRNELILESVSGHVWKHANSRRKITDRDMVEIAQQLHGWTSSVYRFGCAFIHLSSMHDYLEHDPMREISKDERDAIVKHLRQYHGGPPVDDPSFNEIIPFLPHVFEKISSNLECYVKDLESGKKSVD